MEVAQERWLDLVMVSEKADPPVCRSIDDGKFTFEQEKKAKEAKKKSHQTEVKDVKMRYKIDSHDYDVRIGQAQRFLKAGDKVKITVMFRGREQSRPELGLRLLARLAEDVEELGYVEANPKQDGRNMLMVLAPHRRKSDASRKPQAESEVDDDVDVDA